MVALEIAPNTGPDSELPPSKPIPNQARARLKRDALIAAATEDFQQRGYEGTTAKTIADRAQVATGTFYQYFHNKDDMLRVIAHERLEKLSVHISEPDTLTPEAVATQFETMLELVFDFHEQAPELHQVLEQRRHCDPHLQTILQDAEDVFSERILLFVQKFDIDEPEAVTFNLFSMAEALAHRHVFQSTPGVSASREKVIKLGAEMLASYFKDRPLR